ncbi:hypothetical protein M2277_005291 [Paenibacillus sp. LBL]|nr:hypothetical protein [Paenibacillus sp. LBL]
MTIIQETRIEAAPELPWSIQAGRIRKNGCKPENGM